MPNARRRRSRRSHERHNARLNSASQRFATFGLAVTTLARPEGFFAFQRERFWLNTTPHPRWVQAPMLAALAHLITSCESGDCDIPAASKADLPSRPIRSTRWRWRSGR